MRTRTMCFGSTMCPRCGAKGSFKLNRTKKDNSAWYARIDHWENEGFPYGKYAYACYIGKLVNNRVKSITHDVVFHIDEEKRTVTQTTFIPEALYEECPEDLGDWWK